MGEQKKNIVTSTQDSSNGLATSSTQSPTSQKDDIAYEINLPEEVNVNAQRVNPLAGGYSLQDQIPVQRQNELVKEVKDATIKGADNLKKSLQLAKDTLPYAGKSMQELENMNPQEVVKIERAKEAKSRANYEALNNDISLSESIKNSANNAWVQLQKNVPQLQLLATDVFENTLGKELANDWYKWEGRDINQVRLNAYKQLEDLDSELKATKGSISDNLKYMNGSGLVANLADAVFNLGSTALPAYVTGGAATVTSMTGQSIADYNNAKAKSLGKPVEELYANGEAEIGVPLMIGGVATGLEFIGLKGAQNAMLGKLGKGSIAKKAAVLGFETNKEGMTEWLQTGLDEANKALAEGDNISEVSSKAIDKMFSKEGLNSYLMGTLGSLGAAGLGKVSRFVTKPSNVEAINKSVGEIGQLEADLNNPNVSEQAKAVISEQVVKKVDEISTVLDKDIEESDRYTPENKAKIDELSKRSEALSSVVNDENISEVAKTAAQTELDAVTKEIEAIKPEKKAVEEVKTKDEIITPTQEEVVTETIKTPELTVNVDGNNYKTDGNYIKDESGNLIPINFDEDSVSSRVFKEYDNLKNKTPLNEEVQPTEQVTAEVQIPKTEEAGTKVGEESITKPKEETNNATKIGDIEQSSITEREGTTEQQQGGQENRVNQEEPISQAKAETSSSNSVEQGGEKQEKVKTLDRLAHQNIESSDLNDTASNQAREKGRAFTDEERQYNVQKKMDALRHGDDIVVEAKNAFGDNYVNGLLDYIDTNGKTLSADKKQLMYVTLENDLNRQLLADPENLTLKKQEKLVADKSRAFGRETGRAVAMGQLRQLARVGYDASQVTEDFFSPKEVTERRKVEKAVQATPDDINKEYETREESRTDVEIEKAIESGIQKRIDEIYEALPSSRKQRADKAISALERIQKKLRSKTYDASIGVPVAIIDAGITTIKQAIKTGVKVADAIELGIKKIKEKYGKEWKNEDKFRKDMLDGFGEEKIDIEEGSSNTKTDPTVKQALIDAGYSREMTIKNKDGVKEKRQILDWKKLTGAEGSLDNINKVIDQTLGDKGYTSEEIENIKKSLKDEYNDLHASIIEKATNELERRNTPRENNSKILARRLAELYNYGAFDKEPDQYDRLINQTLGVSIKDQAMFDEIKALHKSLADLVDSRDANGRKLSDVALSTAEAKIKNDIKKVIQKVAFSSGNGAYKATVIIKNLVNGMQRQLLNTVGQLVENPISAKYNDLQIQVQDALKKGKWDSPELKAQRRLLSKAAYKSVLVDRGEEYGGVGSPFTTKNAFDDAIRSVAPNKLYQAYVSAVTGTAFLDSSDSAFKIKRTELEFVHNLIRVLTDKSNPNGAMSQQEALQYVSDNLTGQSFEDAKKTAKEIIDSVNSKAGKEILSSSDTNIIRMANDIVKDALVKGEKITKDLVESSFKAAYTTAGTGLGHESNNIITKGLGALNRSVETELNDAIKRKEFNKAAMLNMASILTKNILNPFAGGGANWTIIGMQKMGLPVQYLDPKTYENKRLDLGTVEGLRDAQRALTAKGNLSRSNGRTLIAGTTGLIIAAAVYGSDTDDEIMKWRKKHPVLDKYFNKVIPPALALLTNPDQSTKGKVSAIAGILGDRTGGYGDKERLYAIGKDLAKGKDKQASGRTGDLVGNRFNVPYSPISSSQMAYQVRDLYREFNGLPPIKSKFKNKDGFVKGFFKRGWFDFLGGNEKTKENK